MVSHQLDVHVWIFITHRGEAEPRQETNKALVLWEMVFIL